MSNTTTWAVLCDGRYIRILINDGSGKALTVLKVNDLPAYADLCYQVVNGKMRPRGRPRKTPEKAQ